jgi:hypothetical protein
MMKTMKPYFNTIKYFLLYVEIYIKGMNIDKLYLSITLFISLYLIVNTIQPDFIYNHRQNTLRPFGIGYKNTSILTLWLVSILLAIFSYFIVIYVYYLRDQWF